MKAATFVLAITMAFGPLAASPAIKPVPSPANLRPLEYANVVAFLKETHLKATEVQKRCTVFFEGEWKNAEVYSYCLIIVENSDRDLQLTFYLTDAHEMNWVTEFLDGPFFTSAEKERLFGLMNSGKEVRHEALGRFRVDFARWQPRHAQILVFSFTQPRSQH
jgi:hypothetical protein